MGLGNMRPTTGNTNTRTETLNFKKPDESFSNNVSNVNIGNFLAKVQRANNEPEPKTQIFQPMVTEQPFKRNEFEPEPVINSQTFHFNLNKIK